jgi:hypothetical protein
MVSFMLQTFDSLGKSPQYQQNRRLDVLQGWSGHFGEENTSMPAFETQIIHLIV